MMKSTIRILQLFFLIFLIIYLQLPVFSSNTEMTIHVCTNDLIEKSSFYNNKIVHFEGEVLADVMIRRNGAWLNLSDGSNSAMGVFVPKSTDLPDIQPMNYYKTGDIISVIGIFNKTCAEHSGETDIHAIEIKKIRSGNYNPHPVNRMLAWSCAGLTLILVMLISVYKHKKPGQRTA
jgi:hypothetical protein